MDDTQRGRFSLVSGVRSDQLTLVFLAWVASNSVTSFASKILMTPREEILSAIQVSSTMASLVWVELTFFQLVLGCIVFFVTQYRGQGVFQGVRSNVMRASRGQWAAAVGNLVGHAMTNLAYTATSSASVQVVKACEPIFTFLFALCLVKRLGGSGSGVTRLGSGGSLSQMFLSVVVMCVGAAAFVKMDSTFNVWSLVAAVASNVAFPVRNIVVKSHWTQPASPLNRYGTLCVLSSTLLLVATPAYVLHSGVASRRLFDKSESAVVVLTSAASHVAYNIASLTLLREVSPVTHSVMNLLKRVAVILANMAFFRITVTPQAVLGLCLVSLGLYWHAKARQARTT